MTVRSIVFEILGHDRASSAFLSAAASSEKAATRMQGSMAKMQAASAAMTKAITVPVVALAAVAIKQASDFQKAQTLLQTAGGETQDKMAALGAGIKKIAVDTGTSLGQLNSGMYTVAKFASKLPVTDQLNILKAAAQGAKAENVDLGTAVGALTTIMQSYNVPASRAIATQNELVRASGLAKTSMTDFASSLSAVVPLASALHISQAEVLGAIATMTQHGETAQQSAENLNNLITALAGQNQVASSAMQQLDINTLDLQKNLGKNGLTGTLAIVNQAIADHTHNGMVVISVYKAAALASQSLQQALGGMTGGLATNSQALLTGSMSIKDYQKYAKSLGGEAGAAGLQFLALYKSSEGFSNQLKNGQSTISTSTAQFQKMLGGVTGMGAALKLGGASAQTFANDVAAIGAAAQKNGSDLETWAKTQDTLAVKTDQAKAKLQVLAVNLGTQLLPIATQILGVFSNIAGWFSNLSKGTQGWIIKVALLAAALGPVIGLVTRLGKAMLFLGATGAAMGRFAKGLLLVETSAKTMGTASWAAGFKLRAAFSSAGEAGVAKSGLASFGGSVAAGTLGLAAFAVGVYALGRGINSLITKTPAAAKAFKNLTADTNAWKTALAQTKGALDSNVISTVALSLRQDGMAKLAAKAGVSLTNLTAGVAGTDAQFKALVDTWEKSGNPANSTILALITMHKAFGETSASAMQLAADQKAAADAAALLAPPVNKVAAAAHVATVNLGGTVAATETLAAQAGISKTAVANLIQILGLTPKSVSTTFNVDIQDALNQLAILRAAIAATMSMNNDQNSPALVAAQQRVAALQKTIPGAKLSVGGGQIGAGTGAGPAGPAGGGSAAKFDKSTLTAFANSLKGTYDDVNHAFQAILSSAGSHLSSGMVNSLQADNTKLLGLVHQRNAISAKLAAAQTALATVLASYKNEKSTVAGTVSGTFDVATVQSQYTDQPTSIKTIIASIQTAVANAGRFSTAIKGLIAKHLPQGLIAQLLAAGPAALPQALALLNASKSDLAVVTGGYAKLTQTGQDLGTIAADDFYGAGVKSAQGLVAGLKSQQTILNTAITNLANSMIATMKRALGIHSPSKVMHQLGMFTGQGFLNGLRSQIPAVHKTTAHMVNGPTPRGQAQAWSNGGYTDNRKWEITIPGMSDPVAAAHAMIRHTQMSSRG